MNQTKKHRILVIDDQRSNIMMLEKILVDEYSVYTCDNGLEAIKAAQEKLPDVILLDIVMPEMDGYDIIRALKGNVTTHDIPVIFITGLAVSGAEARGLALGAADFIPKPFTPAIVKLRIQNQLKILGKVNAVEYEVVNYKQAFDAMGIAMWRLDVKNPELTSTENKVMWSKEFLQLFGYEDNGEFPQTIVGFFDLVHPDDRQEALSALNKYFNDLEGKTPYHIEYRVLHKDGHYLYLDEFGTTMRNDSGAPLRISGAARDVTERKQLAQAVEQVKAASKAKSDFFSAMSREILTPVNTIIEKTHTGKKGETAEEKNEVLAQIEETSAHLLKIVNNVLDMAKIEGNKS
jgi:PAS domain S-box-containing protein